MMNYFILFVMAISYVSLFYAEERCEGGSNFNPKEHPNWKLLPEKCGSSSSEKIIGGSNADLGAYPWIARIGYTKNGKDNVEYECGGTLLNKRYVVTASHCVVHLKEERKVVGIRLGELDSRTEVDCNDEECSDPVQDFAPQNILSHEQYNPDSKLNDIALIRLDKDANITQWVKPICVPRGELLDKTHEGEELEVAGWGITSILTRRTSNVLKQLKLSVASNEKCQSDYKNRAQVTPNQLCAGGKVKEDTCGGDSGGPLMKPESLEGPPRYFLIGIVSHGPLECGEYGELGIYTRFKCYLKWLLDKMEE